MSSPSTESTHTSTSFAPTATATSGGVLIASLGQLYLDGNAAAAVSLLATVIAGAGAYVWKYYIEPFLARRRDTDERMMLYKESRKTLVDMRKQRGLSKKEKAEVTAQIHELDLAFSTSVVTRFKSRMLVEAELVEEES